MSHVCECCADTNFVCRHKRGEVKPPPAWPVPRLWPNSTMLVVCSGESAGRQQDLIRRFHGPVIAVKHGVILRPDAQVFFTSGEWSADVAQSLLPKWQGKGQPDHFAIVRGRVAPDLDPCWFRVTRSKRHGTLSDRTDHVTGYDVGTSAINLAYHFGASTIVMVGYDMCGGHFCKHPLQHPPMDHFRRHMGPLHDLNIDAKSKGVRIVNVSPISAVTAFERGKLEDWV